MTTAAREHAWGDFEELSPAECMDLLTAKQVGRVGLCRASGPQIIPVNFSILDGCVLFRTTPYSQLARELPGSRAAFEVDDIDEESQSGWSVLLVGEASHVDELPRGVGPHGRGPTPWPPGPHPLYLRIRPVAVSGRRIHAS